MRYRSNLNPMNHLFPPKSFEEEYWGKMGKKLGVEEEAHKNLGMGFYKGLTGIHDDRDLKRSDFLAEGDSGEVDPDYPHSTWKPPIPKGIDKDDPESFDRQSHYLRTGEWRSPLTGQWYKEDKSTGKYSQMQTDIAFDHEGRPTDTVPVETPEEKTIGDIIEGQAEDVDWGKPRLDMAKWKKTDPEGYENARLKAAHEGRTSPLPSEIPKWAYSWDSDPAGGSGSLTMQETEKMQELVQKRDKYESTKKDLYKLTRQEKAELDSYELRSLGTPHEDIFNGVKGSESRGLLNDLGAFLFGDPNTGEDNIVGKILTGLFGQ